MPIQHAIWKVGATPEALTVSKLATEKDLEDKKNIEHRTPNIEHRNEEKNQIISWRRIVAGTDLRAVQRMREE